MISSNKFFSKFYFFLQIQLHDTRCLKSICDSQDYLQLQKDLDSLYSWSIRSNLLFSLPKFYSCHLNPLLQHHTLISYLKRKPVSSWSRNHNNHKFVLGTTLSSCSWLSIYRFTSRCLFHQYYNINCKKQLHIFIVRSQLMFSSVLWKPHLFKHIQLLECIQRHATKYILNHYTSDYIPV